MGEFNDLIPEFIEESLEHLKNIEEDIILIEQGSADNELINRVFRAVHSIKGGSSFLGLRKIEHLSHRMEDIFNLVRNNDLDFTSHISSTVLKAIDTLKEMLENTDDSDGFDIKDDLIALEGCLDGKRGAATSKKIHVQQVDTSLKLDPYKFESLKKQGKKIYHIQFELKDGMGQNFNNPLDFFREIEKTGEIVERNVDIELVFKDQQFTGDGIPLNIIYATVLEKDLVAYIFGIEEDRVVELKDAQRIQEKPKEADIPSRKTDAAPAQQPARSKPAAEKKEADADAVEEAVTEQEEEEEEEDLDLIKDKNEYLTFLVGDEEYGIGITQVHEIITLQEITPLPGAERYTKGVINLRGDIIPVYDFRMRLDFGERPYDRETIILIVMIHNKKSGIIVDKVSEVLQFTREQIKDAPQMQQIPGEYVIGIGQKENKFVILLKVSEIFKIDEAA